MRMLGPVLDAADPVGLAGFYEALLGWEMTECEGPRDGFPEEDGWARLRSPDGVHKLEFQWERHYARPEWPIRPGAPQMSIHLDIGCDDLEAGVALAVGLGASVADPQPQGHDFHVILLDPEGHPFCLCRG
jgi:hypothetical protein